MTANDVQQLAYQQSSEHQDESIRCLQEVFNLLGVPNSMLDVGCGPGALIKYARSLGIDAVGFDICGGKGVIQADLTEELDWRFPAELVVCWEVAEHLPEEAADVLVGTLVRLVAPGGRLVFTAAVPGQTGAGHINEQPLVYWREKLLSKGLSYSRVETMRVRAAWGLVAGRCQWYPNNVQVFCA
jgi:2-polyprenyl-3-methyl-5-hydroxy-6-metoxy-1,4-benzoquinol methylase